MSTTSPPSESPGPKVANYVTGVLEDTLGGLKTQFDKDDTKYMFLTDDNRLIGPLATISPAECLRFQVVDHTRETAGDVLKIFNHSTSQNIAYKVKSTSPYSYRVRPNSGIIKHGEAVHVQLFLRPDFDGSIHPKARNDKFLIQIMEINNDVTCYLEVQDRWTTVDKLTSGYMQHRMSCTVELRKEVEANWPLLESSLTEVTRRINASDFEKKHDALIQKITTQVALENQSIRNEIQAVKRKLEDNKRCDRELDKQQSSILSLMQFQAVMLVFILLGLILLYFGSSGTDRMDDAIHCADDLSTDCIFPGLPMQ